MRGPAHALGAFHHMTSMLEVPALYASLLIVFQTANVPIELNLKPNLLELHSNVRRVVSAVVQAHSRKLFVFGSSDMYLQRMSS